MYVCMHAYMCVWINITCMTNNLAFPQNSLASAFSFYAIICFVYNGGRVTLDLSVELNMLKRPILWTGIEIFLSHVISWPGFMD